MTKWIIGNRRRGASLLPAIGLTARGACIIAFLAYLIIGPALKQTDIVASTLAYSFCVIIVTLFVVSSIFGRKIRNELSISVHPPQSDDLNGIHAGTDTRLVIKLSPVGIPPLCLLKLTVNFIDEELRTATHIVTGARAPRNLIEDIRFPHRGYWRIASLQLSFEDRFGFTRIEWERAEATEIRVEPPRASNTNYPVVSSAQRSGDMISDVHERKGDPYDLKAYHPSDGMKKILWKVFAKTGQLITRHPEPSMTPEGQVVLFCIADKKDDVVCSAAVQYLDKLLELDLQISLGCEGAVSSIAHNREGALELLIRSVWNTDRADSIDTVGDVETLLESYSKENPHSRLSKVIVFAASRRLATEAGSRVLRRVTETLAAKQVDPVVFVIDNLGSKAIPIDSIWQEIAQSKIGGWFVANEKSAALPTVEIYRETLRGCAQNGWQIITA